ncbi:hypothetical protein KDL01_36695 [Actinospica durhamensis]|uniref:Uncharacterized protein n=1 Tax=Actinospica durhamensis TaxID=1508375 RepID=A0A941F167_9ACTN|nr:hypothetical protein [Actinospica durhamensis]
MFGERVQQQVAQIGAVDLGSLERGVVGRVLLEQQGAVRLEEAHVLALAAGDRVELFDQPGLAQGALPGFGVQVEHPALAARVARGFAFVHDGFDAVHVQHAGQEQPTRAGSHDGDGHGILPRFTVSVDTLYWLMPP